MGRENSVQTQTGTSRKRWLSSPRRDSCVRGWKPGEDVAVCRLRRLPEGSEPELLCVFRETAEWQEEGEIRKQNPFLLEEAEAFRGAALSCRLSSLPCLPLGPVSTVQSGLSLLWVSSQEPGMQCCGRDLQGQRPLLSAPSPAGGLLFSVRTSPAPCPCPTPMAWSGLPMLVCLLDTGV